MVNTMTAEEPRLIDRTARMLFEQNKALVSGQKAKVDASILLIPGRLALDRLQMRATIDLELESDQATPWLNREPES